MPEITLTKRYRTPGGDLDRITFREPVFADFMEIGDVIVDGWKDGTYAAARDYQAIRSYAERLVQEPWNPVLLSNLSIADSTKVRDLITGFFTDGAGSSATQETSSSSTGDGAPTPSAA